jgi:hypothetical protein
MQAMFRWHKSKRYNAAFKVEVKEPWKLAIWGFKEVEEMKSQYGKY